MNFIDWDTYEKEIENQILALWENYEKDINIDSGELNKLVKNEIRSFSARQEVVLKLIDKIKLQATVIENSHPPYFILPTIPLLEYKGDIPNLEYLDTIGITDETRLLLDDISHRIPDSIVKDNKILDAMRQDVVNYTRFLEYISEKSEMLNPVEGINPNYELKHSTRIEIEKYLESRIFVGDTPLNPDAFLQDLILLNRKHQNKIAGKLDITASEVQFENPNITRTRMVDLMIVGSQSEQGYPTIIGIYVLRNKYSIAKLFSYLSNMISEYPEAAMYYKYIYENLQYLVTPK